MDIWSAGCIMAEMITGKTLFKGNDRILHLRGRAGWVAAGCLIQAGGGGVKPCTLAHIELLSSAETWTS